MYRFIKEKKENNNVDFSFYQNKDKYKKILNNLLSIKSRGDASIFTKINRLNHDLIKILSEKDLGKIFYEADFKIKINNFDFNYEIENIQNMENFENMFNFIIENDISISKNVLNKMKLESENLEINKEKIIASIYNNRDNFLNKWKRIKKEINDCYSQSNTWPYYVGAYVIKVELDDKKIHAPLILKEVDILIENNNVYLCSRDSGVVLNEKIIFLIENSRSLTFPEINIENEKISLFDVMSEVNEYFNEYFSNDLQMILPFDNCLTAEINNNNIEVSNNLILIYCSVSGGPLRQAILDLIKENRLDNLIKVNFENVMNESIDLECLVEKPKEIIRICKTDASQEKAIMCAMKDHTIIIGPPGTGKSQTIANILANIMYENKRALFISQKRVALEVVLKRMESLQKYCLQLFDFEKSNKDSKEQFYLLMNQYLDALRNRDDLAQFDCQIKPLVSEDLLEYWKSKTKNIDITSEDIDCIKYIYENIENSSIELINDFKVLLIKRDVLLNDKPDKNLFFVKILENINSNEDELAKAFDIIKEKKLFRLKYPKFLFKIMEMRYLLGIFMEKYKLSNEQIKILNRIHNIDNLLKIFTLENHINKFVPSTNNFEDNKNLISKKILGEKYAAFYNWYGKDQKRFQSFSGRISRRFTPPNKLIALFKKELKEIFNIFVGTPESLSSFVDFANDRFDYVIFDEASQIFLEKALPYIGVANICIIAGDNQQMQPSNWFGIRNESDEQDDQEEDIDSLLDYVIEKGVPKKNLELNYRSLAASLTTFSSRQFYDFSLKSVDANQQINQPIEVVNINGKWKLRINEEEIDVVIELIKEYQNIYESIIILTFNIQQMQALDYKLSQAEPTIYTKITNGDIILKNLENIQGDEADLVIISVGYTKESALSSTYVARKGGRNALNVAITRAKRKMIIVKSIHANEINISNVTNINLITFKEWVNFVDSDDKTQREYSLLVDNNERQKVESGFEEDVLNFLCQQKFTRRIEIVAQYIVGSYRIDFALLDSKTKKFIVGLEVDGWKYHCSSKQRYNDTIREDFLSDKGYKLIRVPQIMWSINKRKVLDEVNYALEYY